MFWWSWAVEREGAWWFLQPVNCFDGIAALIKVPINVLRFHHKLRSCSLPPQLRAYCAVLVLLIFAPVWTRGRHYNKWFTGIRRHTPSSLWLSADTQVRPFLGGRQSIDVLNIKVLLMYGTTNSSKGLISIIIRIIIMFFSGPWPSSNSNLFFLA